MENDYKQKIYLTKHYSFFEKILLNKRKEILSKLKNFLNDKKINDVLDIGSTEDDTNESSNFIIKNLGNFKEVKSISDQSINSKFFSKSLKKSITSKFSKDDIKEFQSDLVISNATIEHVGDFKNQIMMCKNIINLSRKYYIIITPNRYHPLEFHTKIPLIHWLPKKTHRMFLQLFGLNFFANEKNLNLLSNYDLNLIMKILEQTDYKIESINFIFFKSNLILIGKK